MTTTISLATRDCIVLGCDSLATSIVPSIDPFQLVDFFFEQNGEIKLDETGQPILKNAAQVSALVNRVPKDQLPNVTKLYHLKPFSAGVTFAGSSVIGAYSIKNLVDAFLAAAPSLINPTQGVGVTVEQIAQAFFKFTCDIYGPAYQGWADNLKPVTEVLLSGYSFDSLVPEVFRLTFSDKCECAPEVQRGQFNIVYSGQYDVIERVVNGIDLNSYLSLCDRHSQILSRYREKIIETVTDTQIPIPEPDLTDVKFKLFGERFGGVKGLNSNNASLSEQAAINFVEFLIDTMIKAQQFSGSIPTVGGDIHIALITKAGGFKWISKEEYFFKGHAVQKHQQ